MRKGSYVKWRYMPDSNPLKSFLETLIRENRRGPFKILNHKPIKGDQSGKLFKFKNKNGKIVTFNSGWLEGVPPPKRKVKAN
jgi:hypothetical protein